MKRETVLIQTVQSLADREGARVCECLKRAGLVQEEAERLRSMFIQCFVNTAETTTELPDDGDTYVFTGDIAAMWLRDSSAQVVHYLPFLRESSEIYAMVSGLLRRQMKYIVMDPYANAYNKEASGRCWAKDHTDSNDWEWERKYEVDSLCYPLWLSYRFYQETGTVAPFASELKQAARTILSVWELEQHHEQSPYFFERTNCPPSDTLPEGGKGTPVGYTGMTWSGFRPSDDACRYGYLIPSEMFAAVCLDHLAELLRNELDDKAEAGRCERLAEQIREGIKAFGIADEEKSAFYWYEVDGLGHAHFMDDANVPSLLSLPWLGWCDREDPLYLSTRARVLSTANPYYYEGMCASGVGSPHTPLEYIWPISLSMQSLTAVDVQEKLALIRTLMNTDAGTGYMHEGFHKDHPEQFTRSWFAWANSLFALAVMDAADSL